MRLLHVIHTLNPASGGTAEAVRNFVLHPGDSKQAVLTLDHSSDPWTKSYASEVFCVGPGKGNYGYTPKLKQWLGANVSSYDAVIVHGCWQYHGLAASRAARASDVPYLIFPHGMLDPYFKQARLKHFKKILYWRFERTVLENASRVLFTTGQERGRAHECFAFASDDSIVPLGISASTTNLARAGAEFLQRYPQLKGKRVILYLGRLHPKKGVDLLIRAFAAVADHSLHLVIVGPAASHGYLQELTQAAEQIRAQVTFTGMLSGRLKLGAFAAAEVLALPSHQENFGFSVIEALAFGCPVLLSDQVNTWREIVEDAAGFVAPDTEEGTKELLRKWIATEPSQKQQMATSARACFDSRFRAEAAVERFISVVRKITKVDVTTSSSLLA